MSAAADSRVYGDLKVTALDLRQVVELDRRARIVAANDRAFAMLRAQDGILCEDGFLQARLSADDDRLQAALARALPPSRGAGAGGSLAVTRPGGLLPLVLHVVPLDPREDNVPLASVAALVLAVDPNGRPAVDPALVAATLGLTPAQSRVAVLLAEGRSVREAAVAIGRSENAVRWHIRRIFEKQGLSRLAQLVQPGLAECRIATRLRRSACSALSERQYPVKPTALVSSPSPTVGTVPAPVDGKGHRPNLFAAERRWTRRMPVERKRR